MPTFPQRRPIAAVAPAAPVAPTPTPIERYIDRKQHSCGCVTVWDTHGGGSRYVDACGLHRHHAIPFSVAAQHPQPRWMRR